MTSKNAIGNAPPVDDRLLNAERGEIRPSEPAGERDEDVDGDVPYVLRMAAHPGVIVWEEILMQNPQYGGKSMRAVADLLGLRRSNFCAVMAGQRPMSDSFADKLAEVSGIERRLLANLIRSYEDLLNNWDGAYYGLMTEPVLTTAARLDLSEPELAAILGLDVLKIRFLRSREINLDVGEDSFTRAGLLCRVGRLLYDVFGNVPETHQKWLRNYNSGLSAVPIEMAKSITGLADVVDFLQSRSHS